MACFSSCMRILLAAAVATAFLIVLFVQPPVAVGGAYVEAVPPDLALVGFTISNWGLKEVCVVGVEAPPGLQAELHVTEFNGTLAVMRPVDRICVAPFSTVRFGSLTYHVMMVGNISLIKETVRLDLSLSDGRKITITATRGTGGIHIHK